MFRNLDDDKRAELEAAFDALERGDPIRRANDDYDDGYVHDPDAPSWWHGDADASRTTMAAAAMVKASG